MKTRLHLIIYTVVALLLSACESEIAYNPNNQEPQLIMNALLDAGSTDNEVILHLGKGYSLINLNEAALTLYINNQVAETPQGLTAENKRSVKFHLTTLMHPGDNIRLEATAENGRYRVSAEVTVPQPLESIQVDTCITSIRQWGSFRKYRQFKIHLKDRPNEKNYYRLDIENNYWMSARYSTPWLDENGNQMTNEDGSPSYYNKDTTMYYSSHELINREDMILNDGHVSTSDEDENNALFPVTSNKYNVFTDGQFSNSSATLKVYTPLELSTYIDIYTVYYSWLLSINVRLLTLTEAEYNYLRALNYLDDDDYDTTLMEPVSLPTNVKGGLGFVGVSAETKVSIYIQDKPNRDW